MIGLQRIIFNCVKYDAHDKSDRFAYVRVLQNLKLTTKNCLSTL